MTTAIHAQRLDAVMAVLRDCGARSVADLGCGDGDLLVRLAAEPRFERIVGLDPSRTALARARARLAATGADGDRVCLLEGSLTAPPPGLAGHDAAVAVEVIEHLDPDRLGTVERVLFCELAPATLAITTPNREYNALLGVPAHRLRHPDHRFEWDRAKFRAWAAGVARRRACDVDCRDIAGAHPRLGGASQMAVFRRP